MPDPFTIILYLVGGHEIRLDRLTKVEIDTISNGVSNKAEIRINDKGFANYYIDGSKVCATKVINNNEVAF